MTRDETSTARAGRKGPTMRAKVRKAFDHVLDEHGDLIDRLAKR